MNNLDDHQKPRGPWLTIVIIFPWPTAHDFNHISVKFADENQGLEMLVVVTITLQSYSMFFYFNGFNQQEKQIMQIMCGN